VLRGYPYPDDPRAPVLGERSQASDVDLHLRQRDRPDPLIDLVSDVLGNLAEELHREMQVLSFHDLEVGPRLLQLFSQPYEILHDLG